jgi:hypothetical protein
VHKEDGGARRVWVDLERPDLTNTPADKRAAKRIALKRAKLANKKTFVGVERAIAPKVTLEDLEEKWFALLDRSPGLRPSARAAHRSNWNANLKPKLGKHSVASIGVPALRAWIRELVADGASPSTVRNQVNTLTRFFADAKAEHWVLLAANPMRDDEVRAPGLKPSRASSAPSRSAFRIAPRVMSVLSKYRATLGI